MSEPKSNALAELFIAAFGLDGSGIRAAWGKARDLVADGTRAPARDPNESIRVNGRGFRLENGKPVQYTYEYDMPREEYDTYMSLLRRHGAVPNIEDPVYRRQRGLPYPTPEQRRAAWDELRAHRNNPARIAALQRWRSRRHTPLPVSSAG